MIRTFVLATLFAATSFAADDYGKSTVAPVIPPPQPGPSYLQLAPMLGHVSSTDARIWIQATGAAKWSVRASEQADLAAPQTVEGASLEAASAFTGIALLKGLKPATRYFYGVLLDGQAATSRPWPSFVTAPEDGSKGRVRFAFGSCVGKEPWLDAALWADVDARTPVDLVLLLGDNHYANTPDPEKQRAAFTAHRDNAGFRSLFQRTPMYAIWDDHDFGVNDSDGTQKDKESSLRTFKEFFANPAFGEPENPGVYFKFTRGDIDFFLLDDRYHRSPNKAANDENKTMLGAKQLAWLKRELVASKATLKVLAAGGEWHVNGSEDSWKSFPRERKEIFDLLAEHGMKNVLLLSGDRHFTAAYQLPEGFIEVCSGPIGSPNAPAQIAPGIFSLHDHGKMICVFDIDTAGAQPAVAIEIYEAGVGLVEKRKLSWDEVTGAAKIPPLPPNYKTPTMKAAAAKTTQAQ